MTNNNVLYHCYVEQRLVS